MKAHVILCMLFLNTIGLWSQERYFVTAANGLNVRETATTHAAKVGKLPYGALVSIVEITKVDYEIAEEGKTFQSQWVKIKYDNFPYVNPQNFASEWSNTGYVVQYYLEKLNKRSIVYHTIDSTTFYSLYKEPAPDNPTKITSFEEVKKRLDGRVKWIASPLFEESQVIDEIYLPNGQVLDIDEDTIDFAFRAYYPSEEILVFEGGHSSEFAINLKTGETLETTGNPDYVISSPNQEYRLNGWFSGQECSHYFFQKKMGDSYVYLAGLDEDICYFTKFCWLNEGEFVYGYTDNEKGEEEYCRASFSFEQSTVQPTAKTSNFKEVLTNMYSRSLPLTEATNFDDFIEAEDHKEIDKKSLQLEKLYPDLNTENSGYRAIRNYRLEVSDTFYTVVVTLLKNEHEMESILINYGLNGKIIDSKVVSYDEIAEGQSQINSKIKKDMLTVDTIFWGNEKQITTTTFKILDSGRIISIASGF